MATHAATRATSAASRERWSSTACCREYDADALQGQATGRQHRLRRADPRQQEDDRVADRDVRVARLRRARCSTSSGFDLDQINKELVDPKIAATRRVLPLHKRGNRLFVAVSDPANLQALDEVRFKTNLVIDPVVVEDDKLGQAIAKVIETMGKSLERPGQRRATSNVDLDIQEHARRATKRIRKSKTRRSCATSRRYCSTRSAPACPTSISSRTRSSTASAIGSTAY